MFDRPATTTYVAPAEPIDVMQRYLVKVDHLEDMGVSKFAPPDKPYNRIRWVFRMATLDGMPVLDIDGNPYEHYDYTSSKTSKGKEGKVATARLWMEALLGPLDDAEIDNQITERLKEKVAVALFEDKSSSDDNDGAEVTQRIRILKLAPYVKGSAAAAKADREREAAARKARETVATATRTATVAENDDAPF